MTELNHTLEQIEDSLNPDDFNGTSVPFEFPIQVDEASQTVTVAAGIPQRELLEYLSEYGSGWTLPAFSYFIDQTIGGAVATGTHGSSFQHGSLSSQVTSLRLMLANGTVIDVSPDSNPHLFNAAGVSVGRLGIIMDLTMKIVPDKLVERVTVDTNLLDFATSVKDVQDAYNAAIAAGDDAGAVRALEQLEATQAFWHPYDDIVWRTDYVVLDSAVNASSQVWNGSDSTAQDSSIVRVEPIDPFVDPNSRLTNSGDLLPGVFEQVPNENRVAPALAITKNPEVWGRVYTTGLRGMVTPGDFPANKAYVTMSETTNQGQASADPYDQYEASVPFSIAGDCLLGLNELVYGGNSTVKEGFRTPPLIRFVGAEPFYLSPSYGGPVMYINLEDHISLSSGTENVEFRSVMRYLLDECNGRLHWGKAGWPTLWPEFDGAVEYPESWCDFGCAVAELDPNGKFRSESDVWRWEATKGGVSVDFSACCSADGFLAREGCECTPRA